MSTVWEEILVELERCKMLLSMYQEIWVEGVFWATLISEWINKAEKAISEWNIVEIIKSYEELKSFE